MFLQWRYGYSRQNDTRDYGEGEKRKKSLTATEFEEQQEDQLQRRENN